MKTTGWLSSFIVSLILCVSCGIAGAQEVYVCVWRNPERTMTRLFPDAHDYRTVTVSMTKESLARIEQRAGSAMLPGQREQYQYFEMLDRSGNIIGYTQAMTQKGEFGAIELVFGMDVEYRIIGLYIQRQRERDRAFREESFLSAFTGTGVQDADDMADPAGENGTIGTMAVTLGIRKAMIQFDELVLKKDNGSRS